MSGQDGNDNKSGSTFKEDKGASKIAPESEFGYDYFPERKGARDVKFYQTVNFFDRYKINQGKCYMKITKCCDGKFQSVFH